MSRLAAWVITAVRYLLMILFVYGGVLVLERFVENRWLMLLLGSLLASVALYVFVGGADLTAERKHGGRS